MSCHIDDDFRAINSLFHAHSNPEGLSVPRQGTTQINTDPCLAVETHTSEQDIIALLQEKVAFYEEQISRQHILKECKMVIKEAVPYDEAIDVVIMVGPDDLSILDIQLEYTRSNVIGLRTIYLVCADSSIQKPGCVTVNERQFPVTIDDIASKHGGVRRPRNGWYLQQLLKLYVFAGIPGISQRYLVIDLDTLFLRPTKFITRGKALYGWRDEYHPPYFDHLRKLELGVQKVFADKSGVAHHMIFDVSIIKEIIEKVETKHNDTFYNVMLDAVDCAGLDDDEYNDYSGYSEYELYFNYVFSYHTDKVRLRELSSKNTGYDETDSDHDYISCHAWMRKHAVRENGRLFPDK